MNDHGADRMRILRHHLSTIRESLSATRRHLDRLEKASKTLQLFSKPLNNALDGLALKHKRRSMLLHVVCAMASAKMREASMKCRDAELDLQKGVISLQKHLSTGVVGYVVASLLARHHC
jgi:hypothetical protein